MFMLKLPFRSEQPFSEAASALAWLLTRLREIELSWLKPSEAGGEQAEETPQDEVEPGV